MILMSWPPDVEAATVPGPDTPVMVGPTKEMETAAALRPESMLATLTESLRPVPCAGGVTQTSLVDGLAESCVHLVNSKSLPFVPPKEATAYSDGRSPGPKASPRSTSVSPPDGFSALVPG